MAPPPRWVLAPASEQPAPETVRRLEYAYSLRHDLDRKAFFDESNN